MKIYYQKKKRRKKETSPRDLNLIVVVTGIFKITSILIHKLNFIQISIYFSIVKETEYANV